MPYIPAKQRVDIIHGRLPVNAGELNFAITNLITRFIDDMSSELSYDRINQVIGVLECTKLELYRRIAAPYEDRKRDDNGDVFGRHG